MKLLILTAYLLALCACNEGSDTGPGQVNSKVPNLTPAPAYGIRDIWEFVDADGFCSVVVGDPDVAGSLNGCIRFAQLTRFVDGTAYFSLELGNITPWVWSQFLLGGTTTFTRDYPVYNNRFFRLTGSLATSPPTLSINYDLSTNLDFGNTTARTLNLTQVQ